MAKPKDGKETVTLEYEDMDIIFAALEQSQKKSDALIANAATLKAEDAALAQTKFSKRIDDLKQKFLHA